jgi:hypothetical protein
LFVCIKRLVISFTWRLLIMGCICAQSAGAGVLAVFGAGASADRRAARMRLSFSTRLCSWSEPAIDRHRDDTSQDLQVRTATLLGCIPWHVGFWGCSQHGQAMPCHSTEGADLHHSQCECFTADFKLCVHVWAVQNHVLRQRVVGGSVQCVD